MRISISKKLRFEIFKRDSFACQYCGTRAPDVILHVDHVLPVSKGGDNDPLNLVTACISCNAGKGARSLDDRSVIERQRDQLDELQARREQIEMMIAWRDGLEQSKNDSVDLIAKKIEERGGFFPNEHGRANIRRWILKFSFDEILQALDTSFDVYMEWNDDKPIEKAWEKAFSKIPAIASVKRQSVEKPYLPKLFYIQGILRRRCRSKRLNCLQALEEMLSEWSAPIEFLEAAAKRVSSWDEFNDEVWSALSKQEPNPDLVLKDNED